MAVKISSNNKEKLLLGVPFEARKVLVLWKEFIYELKQIDPSFDPPADVQYEAIEYLLGLENTPPFLAYNYEQNIPPELPEAKEYIENSIKTYAYLFLFSRLLEAPLFFDYEEILRNLPVDLSQLAQNAERVLKRLEQRENFDPSNFSVFFFATPTGAHLTLREKPFNLDEAYTKIVNYALNIRSMNFRTVIAFPELLVLHWSYTFSEGDDPLERLCPQKDAEYLIIKSKCDHRIYTYMVDKQFTPIMEWLWKLRKC